MRNFLQNLLIFFALCLCGLCWFQWMRETGLRKDIQHLTDTVQDESQAITNLQGQVRSDEAEIQRLDTLKNELNATVKSNRTEISQLTRDLTKLRAENDRNLQQIALDKETISNANDNVKLANENIEKQKEILQTVITNRDEILLKYNKLASNYTKLADQWNAQQEELAKQATNKPSRK
ncbi:MAG: hypothetical protein C5B50_08070 [Verrucomicrobia bacterium]|nr:MAG: hypothetical protein C5B50_08070 [Verrucomicrobiota bacterium]